VCLVFYTWKDVALHDFSYLQDHKYMNLTTFRKNGQGVPTPVWFVMEHGKLYVVTGGHLGKVKRIRNNPRVTVEPSDGRGKSLGPAVEATARILPDEEGQHAKALLDKRYGLVKKAVDLLIKITNRNDQRTYLEISPAAVEDSRDAEIPTTA
jgi:hypothetical protein